jgi:peroxiredoxin Q/BCP
MADQKVTLPLKPGDPAPLFTLPSSSGRNVSLKDFEGKSLVLFFYPKDDTTACTKEALAFSGLLPKFRRRGTAILGVSRDTIAAHQKFIKKYDLKIPLASDEDGRVCEAYGVWQEKSLYGRKYMGIERSTFLIGPDGQVRHMWRKVRVSGHAEAVYESAGA